MKKTKEPVAAQELKNKKTEKKEIFNNKVVRVFDEVLDSDEKIAKAYKPSKVTMFISNMFKPLIVYFIFIVLFLFLYFNPSEALAKKDCLVVLYVISGLFILFEVVMLLITKRYLENACYIVTNKRVLMSYGFFDINHKFLNLQHVKDVELKWSIFDKINLKKSGQICFYPDEKNMNFVLFYSVDDALESYLEIEELIGVRNDSGI